MPGPRLTTLRSKGLSLPASFASSSRFSKPVACSTGSPIVVLVAKHLEAVSTFLLAVDRATLAYREAIVIFLEMISQAGSSTRSLSISFNLTSISYINCQNVHRAVTEWENVPVLATLQYKFSNEHNLANYRERINLNRVMKVGNQP